MKFAGFPYPIEKHPRGLFHTQGGVDQIKSDLLILLLTNPGERVMLPEFGTPLRELIFEQSGTDVEGRAREMIARSIRTWEPRITIDEITVTTAHAVGDFDQANKQDADHMLGIRIRFFDPENIQNVQELKLEVPLAGG